MQGHGRGNVAAERLCGALFVGLTTLKGYFYINLGGTLKLLIVFTCNDPKLSDSRARSLQRLVRPHCYLVKVRPGLLNLQTEDTFQTLATRDSFGPTVARLMSTHLLAG
jgi:hypothetical protein